MTFSAQTDSSFVATDGPMFLTKADIALPDETLRTLRSSSPSGEVPNLEVLAHAVAQAAGVPVARMEREARRGTFHWVVSADLEDGREVVVRVGRLRHPALGAGLVRDALVCGLMEEIGIPAPAVIGLDLTCRRLPVEFGVFTRIGRKTLTDREPDEAAVARGLNSLGSYLRSVHQVRLPGSGPVEPPRGGAAGKRSLRGEGRSWPGFICLRLEEHIDLAVRTGALEGDEAVRARSALEGADLGDGPADRLLHGDPGGPNIMLDSAGSVVGMVDWEDALVGDPLFDLASAASFHPERRWPALFEGYSGDRHLSPGDMYRFWLYVLRIVLARTVVRHRFAIPDIAGREPAARRVRRALGRVEELMRGDL